MAPVETLDAEELVALLEAEEALLADGHGHALVGCAETVEGLVAVYDHDAIVARLAEDNAALEAEVRRLKADPRELEGRAREDLGMIRDGETFILVLPPAEPSP